MVGAYGVDHEDGNTSDTGAVYVFDYEPSSEIVGSDAGTISHTVSGLVNYRTYSIAVRARNEAGPGPGVVVTANRPPVFDVGTSINLQIPENASPGTPVGDPILAIDPDNDSIQHAFGGAPEDADVFSFNIDTGQISVDRAIAY